MKRILIVMLAAVLLLLPPASAPHKSGEINRLNNIAAGIQWDYENDLTDRSAVLADFSPYFLSAFGAYRYDIFDNHWIAGSEGVERINDIDTSKTTDNMTMLLFNKEKFSDFELEVEYKQGNITDLFCVIAIRQQFHGAHYLEEAGGAGFFMSGGSPTLWGALVSAPKSLFSGASVPGFDVSKWHTVKITTAGNNVDAYVDGILALSHKLYTADYAQGYVSLYVTNNNGAFKNFKIRHIPKDNTTTEKSKSPYANEGTPLDAFNL